MLISKVKTSIIYKCSLERAFKTPMLCDITKVHTGYGITPKVSHTTEDEDWGKINSSKKIHTAKNIMQKGGFNNIDNVLERVENKYWKIQVDNFQFNMFGFEKFVGEWQTTEIKPNEILVEYTYTMYSNNMLLFPLNWIFAKTFWRIYMQNVLKNIRKMAYNKEPYLFE